MIVFQLILFSCITTKDPLDLSLVLSKICRWDPKDQYINERICNEAGAGLLMSQVFSDVYEDRRVEGHRCSKVWIKEQ
jgi:hypothetical protein